MQIHTKLPEGAFKPRYESEFYRLLPRKKVLYEDNREFRLGMRYLIWSKYGRVWYERRLDPLQTTEEDITYYLLQGVLRLWPEEEHKEEIREDVENSQLPYYTLMKRRQAEMDFERQNRKRNDGDGYRYKLMLYKGVKDKYKIKKT